MCEVLVCHPLDTIKVRMQLARKAGQSGAVSQGIIGTAAGIVKNESFFSLYRGLGAVLGGIIPKMAIRFTSYEYYKQLLSDKETMEISRNGTFLAGLAAGITEAVTVVNAVEVIKIRLQALPAATAATTTTTTTTTATINGSGAGVVNVIQNKYRNTPTAISTLIREEGIGFLYRGVTLTALRQGTNQAANFTVYTELKSLLQKWQGSKDTIKRDLPSYQTTIIGLISGAVGPFSNAPIDTIKTRIQQQSRTRVAGQQKQSNLSQIITITTDMLRKEGIKSFYKGITPRVLRVAPGQAVTFTVYEFLKGKIEGSTNVMRGRQII